MKIKETLKVHFMTFRVSFAYTNSNKCLLVQNETFNWFWIILFCNGNVVYADSGQ